MPQEQTKDPAQQLDPAFDYAEISPGKYAQFKKGTPPDQMRSMLTQKGLLKPPASPSAGTPPPLAQPQQPSAPPAVAKPPAAPASQLPSFGQRFGQTMQIPTTMPELGSALKGASGLGTAIQTGKGMYEGVKAGYEDIKAGRLIRGIAEAGSGFAPYPTMLGSNIGEDIVTKNKKGTAGTAIGLMTQGLLMHYGGMSADEHKMAASKLDNKVAKLAADGSARDYNLSSSWEVAQKKLIGGYRRLAGDGVTVGEAEKARAAEDVKVKQLAAKHDAAGHTVDAQASIDPLIKNMEGRLNAKGLVTGQARVAVRNILDQLKTERDIKTGTVKPVDLTKLSMTKAIELTKGLGEMAHWDKTTKLAVEQFTEHIRKGISEAIDKVDPEITKTRAREHNLLEWRDSVRAEYAKILDDKVALGARAAFKSIGSIGAYLALKALGVYSAEVLGAVILGASFWNSPLSRTARAALHAYMYDLLKEPVARLKPPANAGGAPGGPPPPPPPSAPPGAPQGAANAGAGQPAAAPPGTPPSAAPTPPVAPAAPTPQWPANYQKSPAAVSAAGGGGANFTAADLAALKAKHGIKDIVSAPVGAPAAAPPVVVDPPSRPVGEKMVPVERRASTQITQEYNRRIGDRIAKHGAEKAVAGQSAAQSSTTSVSDPPAGPESHKYDYKAIYDGLVSERKGAAKSGMEAEQIKKMTAEMERALSGKATKKEMAVINKHIADRLRVAGHRRTTASQATSGAPQGAGAGLTNIPAPTTAETSRGVSVQNAEDRAIKLDLGYKHLSTIQGGKEWVANLKKLAKEMPKIDKDWDELEKLKEALKMAHGFGEESAEPEPQGDPQ
jgi:hypothetical protein